MKGKMGMGDGSIPGRLGKIYLAVESAAWLRRLFRDKDFQLPVKGKGVIS